MVNLNPHDEYVVWGTRLWFIEDVGISLLLLRDPDWEEGTDVDSFWATALVRGHAHEP